MRNGEMVSLPIPSETSKLRYSELRPERIDTDLGKLVSDLTGMRFNGKSTAHLDPDLDRTSLRRPSGWRPAFGQIGASATHLENQEVDEDDLFLFFGYFRHVELVNGCWQYKKRGSKMHVLFGWLRVANIIKVVPPHQAPCGLGQHPHFDPGFQIKHPTNNIVYAGAPCDSGIFPRFNKELCLTRDGATRRNWRLPKCFCDCGLSHHSSKSWTKGTDCCYLKTTSPGQEFVVDCKGNPAIRQWAESVIKRHGVAADAS